MALIKCPECGKEISDSAQSCPSCGCPLKKEGDLGQKNIGKVNSNKKKPGCLQGCLGAIGAFVILCIIVSFMVTTNGQTASNGSGTNVVKSSEEKKDDLEVLSYDGISEGGLRYVTGEIRNNTEKNYSYVQVEINMKKDDIVLGSTLANVNNLGPGETWKFKALITDNECNKYTIKDVTGF